MNRDGVDRMFPFVKRDSEWGSKHEPKKYLLGGGGEGVEGLIRFVSNSHVYQAPKSNCFIAAHITGANKELFSVYIYLFWNFLEIKMSGAVNPNTPHSPPACSMFNEIAQCLKLFMFFSGVAIMTSAS